MIIWHNEAHRPTAAGLGVTTDAPVGLSLEITRLVEERGGNYHIWFALLPAAPAVPDVGLTASGMWRYIRERYGQGKTRHPA